MVRDLEETAGLLDGTLLFAKTEADSRVPALDLVPLLAAILDIREELGQPLPRPRRAGR